MQTLKAYLIDITYKVERGKPAILLFCRTPEGKRICLRDKNFEPYFIAQCEPEAVHKLESLSITEEGVLHRVTLVVQEQRNIREQPSLVYKVFCTIPKSVAKLRDLARTLPEVSAVYEDDILFTRRYLLDKHLTPFMLLETKGDYNEEFFDITTIQPIDGSSFSPNVLAFDIETYYKPEDKTIAADKNPILMIAVYGKEQQTCITWKQFPTNDTRMCFVADERAMIARFIDIIKTTEPDVLCGYYSDGFDFPYLVKRAELLKIPLTLGLDGSTVTLRERTLPVAEISGIAHIDIFKFIRHVVARSLKTDVYTLDAVSSEVLGERKKEVDLNKLNQAWDTTSTELALFCDYNIHDATLAFNLWTAFYPSIIEFIRLIGLSPTDITRMSFSQLVEWFIIKKAIAAGEVILSKPRTGEEQKRTRQRVKGAFVFEPTPGFYKNIAVFDYRSLYPSIITAHNISLGTLGCECCKTTGTVPIEEGTLWFCTHKKGFLSTIIEDIIKTRAAIKKQLKTTKDPLLAARSEALKLLANSFYGYLGFAPARWYSIECASATTAWGRHHIHTVIEEAKKAEFTVLYGDSLPHDRRIFIQTPAGDTILQKIGTVYDNSLQGIKTLSYTKDGKVTFLPVQRVIRHPMRKEDSLLKITTKYGTTVVTNQHSVYTYRNGLKLTHAGALQKGDTLISLTNPQIQVKYCSGHVFDVVDLDLGPYAKELLLYGDKMVFSAIKSLCPYCQKIVHLASHVHAAHKERRQLLNKNSLFTFVGGTSAQIGKIPRYWILDDDLAWVLGFYCAEGSASDMKTKSGRKSLISFGGQDIDLINKVKRILDTKLHADLKIIKSYDARIHKYMYYYRVQRVPLVALFKEGFGAGSSSEFKKVPFFIFSSEESIRKAFIQGYLDGDGNKYHDKRYKTHFSSFSTKSIELAIGLQFLLKSLHHGKNAQGNDIQHVYWLHRKDKPKIVSLRLQSAPQSKQNFCLAEIKSIERMPSEQYVYDLEVAGSHNFVDAEGMLLVHNTDSVFLLAGSKTKQDLLSFGEHVNRSLPGLMELEFEGLYISGIFVSTRANEGGAKKKYALLDEKGNIKIRGFETVRRNFSFIAKEVQKEVLNILLREGNTPKATTYVRSIVDQLRKNIIPLEKVVIHTQLQKSIEAYENVGPHVAAAMRMREHGEKPRAGTIIKFIVAKGEGKIRDKVRLINETQQQDYDGEYYINNQVLPSIERIFAVLGVSADMLQNKAEQKTLSNFSSSSPAGSSHEK